MAVNSIHLFWPRHLVTHFPDTHSQLTIYSFDLGVGKILVHLASVAMTFIQHVHVYVGGGGLNACVSVHTYIHAHAHILTEHVHESASERSSA